MARTSCAVSVVRPASIVAALVLPLALPLAAESATRYVKKSGNDWGNSTCSAASPCASITNAATVATSGDVIQVGAGTFVEPGVQVDKNLTITGAGRRQGTNVTITNDGSVFRIAEGVTATIEKMKIYGGKALDGGGIHNRGTLTVRSVLLHLNKAGRYGGGIYNSGRLTLDDVSVLMNSASLGGGLMTAFDDSEALVIASSILWNTATQAHNDLGQVGGIAHGGPGHLILVRSAVAWNTSVGIGSLSGGPLILQDSTVSSNGTTGILLIGTPSTLTNVTIAGNKSYGLDVRATEVEVRNSIVARNAPYGWGSTGPQCSLQTAMVFTNHSLFGDLSCDPIAEDWAASLFNVDPHLTPLGYHGGSTPLHRLLPGSPAIDAAASAFCWPWDQHGSPRPVDGNGDGVALCDMGAQEAKPLGRLLLPDVSGRR